MRFICRQKHVTIQESVDSFKEKFSVPGKRTSKHIHSIILSFFNVYVMQDESTVNDTSLFHGSVRQGSLQKSCQTDAAFLTACSLTEFKFGSSVTTATTTLEKVDIPSPHDHFFPAIKSDTATEPCGVCLLCRCDTIPQVYHSHRSIYQRPGSPAPRPS